MTQTLDARAESSSAVALTVNGERREVARGTTLADFLRALALDPRMVVVEHNRVILRDRDAYPSLDLRSGDTLEIVHFVGGG
ncbi:MAG TPA: sulfur carrier protein ThiS [Gemmatimonadaceae bacterium]|nr:sulfur carrier protein ThiS [Gemmatimonadaceae bacterium]